MVAAKDPSKGHFYVSLVKSAARLVGCYFLWSAGTYMVDYPIFQYVGVPLQYAAFALGAAEILGIAEELV